MSPEAALVWDLGKSEATVQKKMRPTVTLKSRQATHGGISIQCLDQIDILLQMVHSHFRGIINVREQSVIRRRGGSAVQACRARKLQLHDACSTASLQLHASSGHAMQGLQTGGSESLIHGVRSAASQLKRRH